MGSANVLSKDEQIAYRSLALIPLLSKRQAGFEEKYYLKGRFWTGKLLEHGNWYRNIQIIVWICAISSKDI